MHSSFYLFQSLFLFCCIMYPSCCNINPLQLILTSLNALIISEYMKIKRVKLCILPLLVHAPITAAQTAGLKHEEQRKSFHICNFNKQLLLGWHSYKTNHQTKFTLEFLGTVQRTQASLNHESNLFGQKTKRLLLTIVKQWSQY